MNGEELVLCNNLVVIRKGRESEGDCSSTLF